MDRRAFLRLVGLSVGAAATVDLDRLLWTPGKVKYFDMQFAGAFFRKGDIISIEGHGIFVVNADVMAGATIVTVERNLSLGIPPIILRADDRRIRPFRAIPAFERPRSLHKPVFQVLAT